jgi:hypothetical protein
MLDKIKHFAGKAKETISSTVVLVGDFNGDGKVDQDDLRIATEWAKKKASAIGNEASQFGKEAVRTGLAKDVASSAAVGAAVAIPVPVIGPLLGAAIGAGVGVYKNLSKKNQAATTETEPTAAQPDVQAPKPNPPAS